MHARRRGHMYPLASKRPKPLWAPLLSAAFLDEDRALFELRGRVERAVNGGGEFQGADLEVLQQLVALKAVAVHGCVDPARRLQGEPPQSSEAQRRALTSEALNVVLQHLKGDDADGRPHQFKYWAASLSNTDGVQGVLRWALSIFQTHEEAQEGFPQRNHGRQLAPIDASMRWAAIAPLLSVRMTERVQTAQELERFRQNISAMYEMSDAGILALSTPSAGSAAQYLYALGSELGDLFAERDAMLTLMVHRLHSDNDERGLPELKTHHMVHVLGERIQTDHLPTTSQDRAKLDGYFERERRYTRRPLTEADLRTELLKRGLKKRSELQSTRSHRETEDEAERVALRERWADLQTRYRRVKSRADAEHSAGGWEALAGSSKLQALVRLLDDEIGATEKAVVFTRFGTDAVKATCRHLHLNGIMAVSLRDRGSGDLPPVEAFRTRSDRRVLVLHADTSAAGLTLTCARHVIFLDVLPSAALESQAKARVARIGQTAETTAWHLVAENTIDLLLRDAADRKAPLVTGDEGANSIGWILRAAAAMRAMPRAEAGAVAPHADPTSAATQGAQDAQGAQGLVGSSRDADADGAPTTDRSPEHPAPPAWAVCTPAGAAHDVGHEGGSANEPPASASTHSHSLTVSPGSSHRPIPADPATHTSSKRRARDRLAELKELLEEDLINAADYEAKKAEILSTI